ncbi:hypothetical protein BGZ98_002324 [Dissophora globulifera]|nr:hypothetical protein BGZ98_002324 [Dissophora globulifera]
MAQEGNDTLSMDLFGHSDLDFELAGPSALDAPPGSCSPTSSTISRAEASIPNGPSLPSSFNGPEARGPTTKHVPKPLDLTLASSMDSTAADAPPSAAMSMTTFDTPSPTQSCSPPASMPSSPSSPSYEDALQPVVACGNCKRSHIKCDHGRPCQNCLKHTSKASTCRDAVPKPRGRPKGISKNATMLDPMLAMRLQQQQQQHHHHPGWKSFANGSFLHLHGQSESPSPQHFSRQRAVSFSHMSSAYDAAYLAMLQDHEQQEQLQYQHQRAVTHGLPSPMSPWGGSSPSVPEMSTISEIHVGSTHPLAAAVEAGARASASVCYPTGLDAYELQQLQKHRQQLQQHQQQQQQQQQQQLQHQRHSLPPNAKLTSHTHKAGMMRPMSDHFKNAQGAPAWHFHSEHHQQLLQQQQQLQQPQALAQTPSQQQKQQQSQPAHPYQRPRPHPGHSLTLMIPSTSDGRSVVSAAPSPVSAGFPVSPGFPTTSSTMLPPVPPSPTHPYHAHHAHHAHHHGLHAPPPLSPIGHGPVMAVEASAGASGHDAASMARLIEQELVIKHDLEMHEQQGLQKQQELARIINLQKLQLQQQYQQHQLAALHEQGRARYHRRASLQLGLTNSSATGLGLGLGLSAGI